MARERFDIPLSEWKRRERALIAKQRTPSPPHTCEDHVEYIENDSRLGQAWYCSVCGTLLQVG